MNFVQLLLQITTTSILNVGYDLPKFGRFENKNCNLLYITV